MAVRFSQVVTVPDTVLFQEIEGEAVLLSLGKDTYFGLNEVGTRMWHVTKSAASLQEAYELLLGEFEVDADVLAADLDRFVSELLDKGLLVVADA